MTLIPLKDILISARQESHRMRHYYLGIEHLFIALLEIRSGLASLTLSDFGLNREYVIDAIRRKVGKGSRHRLWTGIPETPRAQIVLGIARDIAAESGHPHISERDLLLAILEEDDNVATRTLSMLNVDMQAFREAVQIRQASSDSTQAFTVIEFPPDFEGELTSEQLFILRRIFHGVARIRIEAQLTGGYTGALLLVVTPIHIDNREQASVVVKIGTVDSILDEAQRYERHVKGTLPPLTARLEDKPIAPEASELAGLKYTFLSDSTGKPANLRMTAHEWIGEKLGRWLQEHLYSDFGVNWWKQNRPYRFEAWREYDWMLPPMLTLRAAQEEPDAEHMHTLRSPIRRSIFQEFEFGEHILVENFVVQKVDLASKSIRLALAQGTTTTRPYQIEIQDIDFDRDTFYRGEIVERISGTIYQTRDEQLMLAIRNLEPDFDSTENTLSIDGKKLPNPIMAHHEILDLVIYGTLSTIHGDLHLGNILVGPNESALLIDFGMTRDGHTLFDWANLEVSILSEVVVPQFSESWDSLRSLLWLIAELDTEKSEDTPTKGNHLEAIRALRQIAQSCLASPDNWVEYYLALAISALRAMLWQTMTQSSRRFMYLLAALAMQEVKNRYRSEAGEHTPAPDATDFYSTDG